MTGSTGEVYARTGYLGFLRRTEAITVHAVPGIASEATEISDLSALAINAPPTDSSGKHHFIMSLCLDQIINIITCFDFK